MNDFALTLALIALGLFISAYCCCLDMNLQMLREKEVLQCDLQKTELRKPMSHICFICYFRVCFKCQHALPWSLCQFYFIQNTFFQWPFQSIYTHIVAKLCCRFTIISPLITAIMTKLYSPTAQILYRSKVCGWYDCFVFDISILCSPRLHLFFIKDNYILIYLKKLHFIVFSVTY